MPNHLPGTGVPSPRPPPGRLPFSRFPSEPDGDASDAPADLDAECDYCGREVRRETASQRVHNGDDGDEVVFLCHECEFGAD